MNKHFINTIINQTNLLVDDSPQYFPNLVPDVEKYITWNDIEYCMNNPQKFFFDVVGPDNKKITVPDYQVKWQTNLVQDKQFLFDSLIQGHGMACLSYGDYSKLYAVTDKGTIDASCPIVNNAGSLSFDPSSMNVGDTAKIRIGAHWFYISEEFEITKTA